jgi:hypothetical protein
MLEPIKTTSEQIEITTYCNGVKEIFSALESFAKARTINLKYKKAPITELNRPKITSPR